MSLWTHIHHRDKRALQMADRHYSRKTPGALEFIGPGHKVVLMHFAPDGSPAALWASQRPAPDSKITRADHLDAWDCTMFRIEQRTVLASELITAAVQSTMAIWGALPRDGFVTTIDPRKVPPIKVRGVETWGYSYTRAGWQFLRITKARKLIMLQLPRESMGVLQPVLPLKEYEQAQFCFHSIPRGCAPANWRELPPWCDDYRVIGGERVRSAYPLYYRDEAGVIWEKKHDVSGEYVRWH